MSHETYRHHEELHANLLSAPPARLPYNPRMRHLDILLPFALPATAMGPDLLRAMATPSLALLLARSQRTEHRLYDPFARALPHESWLAHAFGLRLDPKASSSPPVALQSLQRFGQVAEQGFWFVLNPVHIHIARDHLVLTDSRRLELSENEARELFALAAPVCGEYDKQLVYGDATTWFVRADGWRDLLTSTPDATCGHNIDIWMPKGPAEREWRRLQNEIQMLWHADSVNAHRTMNGQPVLNSLWLWGGADMSAAPMRSQAAAYDVSFNLSGWMAGLATLARRQVDAANAAEVFAARPESSLLLIDDLIEPALGGDMGEWLLRMNALEANWFAPLLEALRSGSLERCRLILTSGTMLSEVTLTRTALRKFWKKPSLAGLLA